MASVQWSHWLSRSESDCRDSVNSTSVRRASKRMSVGPLKAVRCGACTIPPESKNPLVYTSAGWRTDTLHLRGWTGVEFQQVRYATREGGIWGPTSGKGRLGSRGSSSYHVRVDNRCQLSRVDIREIVVTARWLRVAMSPGAVRCAVLHDDRFGRSFADGHNSTNDRTWTPPILPGFHYTRMRTFDPKLTAGGLEQWSARLCRRSQSGISGSINFAN